MGVSRIQKQIARRKTRVKEVSCLGQIVRFINAWDRGRCYHEYHSELYKPLNEVSPMLLQQRLQFGHLGVERVKKGGL